ncbi:alpha/beta hydrolase [Agromyces intestinalis]|uniref:Alpha/beta hydrolase n=1 Tax=Agromyces intestinalis TaxID=2592652 RepID=A0A5C1YIK4_9MICO|nr:alpha/beta hydrolase [Agromyces intestinalis]QEO14612.1 alpha/beta hydrolase [Agromyces intestinalis]
MHPIVTTAFASLRAAERVSPALAAGLAMPLFRSTRPPAGVRPGDRAVHDQARATTLRVAGREVRVYEWGSGGTTVLLSHGWRGRASQFGAIIRELRPEGVRLVAYDAPAAGGSPGRHADIRDWLAVISELQQRHGRFHTMIGHSFGSLATLTAVREGIATGGVVAIAGMADARYLVDGFGTLTGLGPATTDVLAARFARIIRSPGFEASGASAAPGARVATDATGSPDGWRRFDAARDPLPAEVPLLVVHDRGDREVAVGEALRLHTAHGERSRLVLTSGAGHNAVLGADATLDAVVAFVQGGLAAVDAANLSDATDLSDASNLSEAANLSDATNLGRAAARPVS